MFGKIQITKMSKEEYKFYLSTHFIGEPWDFPIEEIGYLLEKAEDEQKVLSFAYVVEEQRLYEM